MTHLNPESKVINPDVIKACAELVCPGEQWVYNSDIGGAVTAGRQFNKHFDPVRLDQDAWALEDALHERKNGGWNFGKVGNDNHYSAFRAWPTMRIENDTDKKILLLKCVASIKGLEVWV